MFEKTENCFGYCVYGREGTVRGCKWVLRCNVWGVEGGKEGSKYISSWKSGRKILVKTTVLVDSHVDFLTSQ